MASKHIIFDVSGTLFRVSRYKTVRELGFWDSITFIVQNMRRPKTLMYDSIFDILNRDNPQNSNEHDQNIVRDGNGKPIPALMKEWFIGKKTGQQILNEVQDLIEQYTHFTDKSHKKMVQETLSWLFNPKRYANSLKPIDDAVDIVEDCAEAKNADGLAKNDFWILSNFDPETFKYLYEQERNQRVFKYIPWDHVFISGFMKMMKPDPQIFAQFLARTKLNPADCIFIDNQPENIVAARHAGMQAIWLQDADYDSVKKQLQSLGAL